VKRTSTIIKSPLALCDNDSMRGISVCEFLVFCVETKKNQKQNQTKENNSKIENCLFSSLENKMNTIK
jgi:hypothetical protein